MEPYYRTLYEQALKLKPQRIVEFGVRAGYSGLVFALANSSAEVWCYDAALDPDSDDQLCHAEQILAGRNYHLRRADSQSLDRLPQADLVYIDGDRSYAGCLADLRLAAGATDNILVDDYGASQTVQLAVSAFWDEHHPHFASMDKGVWIRGHSTFLQ